MAGYPPYQQPLVERAGRVTTPWQRFFLQLAQDAAGGAPADAEYVVGAVDPALPNARVPVPSATITWVLTTPGQVSAEVIVGSVTFDRLQDLTGSPRLLGRGSPGAGPVEEITLGAGLLMTGTVLSATGGGGAAAGYWTELTNGDPVSPELVWDSFGNTIDFFVPV